MLASEWTPQMHLRVSHWLVEIWRPVKQRSDRNTRWNTTRFSSEIKHFLLFHLRRHVKNSGFVLHHGFQTPRNRWKHEAAGLVLSSVSRCLESVMKHSPSFLLLYITWKLLYSNDNLLSTKVKSSSIVVGIVKAKKRKSHLGHCQWPLSCLDLRMLVKKFEISLHLLTIQQMTPYRI